MELRVTFGGVVVCTVTVFPQGPLNGMQMTNETETGDIAIEGGFAGVSYEEVQKACPGEPSVIQNNGVYDLGTMTFDSKSGIKLDIG